MVKTKKLPSKNSSSNYFSHFLSNVVFFFHQEVPSGSKRTL